MDEMPKMWDAEEDLRWCANIFLIIALGGEMAGVLIGYQFTGTSRWLIIAGMTAVCALIAAAGCLTHYFVWRHIKETTILRFERRQK